MSKAFGRTTPEERRSPVIRRRVWRAHGAERRAGPSRRRGRRGRPARPARSPARRRDRPRRPAPQPDRRDRVDRLGRAERTPDRRRPSDGGGDARPRVAGRRRGRRCSRPPAGRRPGGWPGGGAPACSASGCLGEVPVALRRHETGCTTTVGSAAARSPQEVVGHERAVLDPVRPTDAGGEGEDDRWTSPTQCTATDRPAAWAAVDPGPVRASSGGRSASSSRTLTGPSPTPAERACVGRGRSSRSPAGAAGRAAARATSSLGPLLGAGVGHRGDAPLGQLGGRARPGRRVRPGVGCASQPSRRTSTPVAPPAASRSTPAGPVGRVRREDGVEADAVEHPPDARAVLHPHRTHPERVERAPVERHRWRRRRSRRPAATPPGRSTRAAAAPPSSLPCSAIAAGEQSTEVRARRQRQQVDVVVDQAGQQRPTGEVDVVPPGGAARCGGARPPRRRTATSTSAPGSDRRPSQHEPRSCGRLREHRLGVGARAVPPGPDARRRPARGPRRRRPHPPPSRPGRSLGGAVPAAATRRRRRRRATRRRTNGRPDATPPAPTGRPGRRRAGPPPRRRRSAGDRPRPHATSPAAAAASSPKPTRSLRPAVGGDRHPHPVVARRPGTRRDRGRAGDGPGAGRGDDDVRPLDQVPELTAARRGRRGRRRRSPCPGSAGRRRRRSPDRAPSGRVVDSTFTTRAPARPRRWRAQRARPQRGQVDDERRRGLGRAGRSAGPPGGRHHRVDAPTAAAASPSSRRGRRPRRPPDATKRSTDGPGGRRRDTGRRPNEGGHQLHVAGAGAARSPPSRRAPGRAGWRRRRTSLRRPQAHRRGPLGQDARVEPGSGEVGVDPDGRRRGRGEGRAVGVPGEGHGPAECPAGPVRRARRRGAAWTCTTAAALGVAGLDDVSVLHRAALARRRRRRPGRPGRRGRRGRRSCAERPPSPSSLVVPITCLPSWPRPRTCASPPTGVTVAAAPMGAG